MQASPGLEIVLQTALKRWRDELINLTGRNRLLNFKPTGTSSLQIVRLTPSDILNRLRGGSELRFRTLALEAHEAGEVIAGDISMRAPAGPVVEVADEGDDEDILYVDVPAKNLSSALRLLKRRSDQEFLDRGIGVLYVAFGIVAWADEDDTQHRSPLLLVPVQLVGRGPRSLPELQLAPEDAVVNPALTLKFSSGNVELPGIDDLDALDLEHYLAQAREALRSKPSWRIDDEVQLSYFSFAKEAMYRDLLDNEDRILQHPVVTTLAAGGAARVDFDFDEIPDAEIDAKAPADSMPMVLDADSSQRACVAAALEGRSFVLDGPPGTGKSQTIANMISALLYAGRKVLFVSEKAAALEVVKDRLAAVGLDAFLLELHSHKATRREVAIALGEALHTEVEAPTGMPRRERQQLRGRQEELNAYARAMNQRREPLGFSVQQVLGRLTELKDVPAASPPDLNFDELSAERLEQIVGATARLARVWQPALEGTSHLWAGIVTEGPLESLLYQARLELTELRQLVDVYSSLLAPLAITRPSDARRLQTLLSLRSEQPDGTPVAWLTIDSLIAIRTTVESLTRSLEQLRAADSHAQDICGVQWRRLPDLGPEGLDAKVQVPEGAPAPVNLHPLEAEAAKQLATDFEAGADMLTARLRSASDIAGFLGLPAPETFKDLERVLNVARVAEAPERPPAAWISGNGYNQALQAVEALQTVLRAEDEAQDAARVTFTDTALNADVLGLHERFRDVHKGMRKLGGSYREDKRLLATLIRPGGDADAAVKALPAVIDWRRSMEARRAAEAQHAPALMGHYAGPETDFARIIQLLHVAHFALSQNLSLDRAAVVLTAPEPSTALIEAVRATRDDLTRWTATLAPAPTAAPSPGLLHLRVIEAVQWLRAHVSPARSAAAGAASTSDATGRQVTLAEAARLARIRAERAAAHISWENDNKPAAALLGPLYAATSTDLGRLKAALNWAIRMRRECNGNNGPASTGTPALSLDQVEPLLAAASTHHLEDAISAWEHTRTQLLDAFGPTRQEELREELDDYSIAADLLTSLAEDTGGRLEWFAHRDSRLEMVALGLGGLVDFCIRQRLAASALVDTVERALLTHWAEYVLAREPILRASRSQDRDALVQEFRDLDRQLVQRAVGDIVQACNSRRPRIGAGESSIIAREAEKKRKHMPVRALIDRTRNVTQAIKPCFMMSPLAVSQFLPADIRFDVVIFDEASQVSPADAINCIYRADALIAAGDQKQLPPTNFFGAGTEDAEEEWTEESDDVKDFESILDLAKGTGSLRSLTLRWHYRSRHESLITFSNSCFYDGRLVTFPSNQESGPDVGVELFVVDGVYRRASSRDNLVEADLVAERVLHHFDTRPGQSLGVVTFSESQAAAVHDAVDRARQARPDLEHHFTDGRLDGFFVKNLESVQGDERDVMIFSIGYGPDENGKTTMNFGPLNKSGGQRRLNVAITRARYRNEIVASIRAGDITESARSEGVMLLRRYLDFASRGVAALALDMSTGGDAESPFEESVLATVRSWGYDVTPQIGTAGYRVDMAVRHPDHRANFVLGIECDGFQYHSSKVARDRDRLREEVLEGLGWRLHRIWGTSWYRYRAHEEERLKQAIEQAIAHPVNGLLGPARRADAQSNFPVPPITVRQRTMPEGPPEWATRYRTASLDPLPGWLDPGEPAAADFVLQATETIAETEGPVHLSLIHQRMRDAWNIGRVSLRVRRVVEQAIARSPRLYRDGDFIGIRETTTQIARTPVDEIRKIEHVHEDELAFALINIVQDAGGIGADELCQQLARLFGWNRRGPEIAARLDRLVQAHLRMGLLAGNPASLSMPPVRTT